MFEECCTETMPNANALWLKLRPLCNTAEENDSNVILTQDISKEVTEMARIRTIENLSLLGNQLSHLPNNLTESLTNLVYLNLSNNQLKDLPGSLNVLKKLVYLNINCNKLFFIPNVVCELDSLKTLTARTNHIQSVPKHLGDLSNLEDLDLSFNGLSSLPSTCEKLNSLKKLSLVNNKFKVIPKCVASGMQNLEIFDFSRNIRAELKVSPKSVNLIAFYAESNNLCPSFPLWILYSKYNKLEMVSLNETRFEVFKLPDVPFKSSLKKLSMKQCKIFETTVERMVAGMTSLEQLLLGNYRVYNGNNFWCLPIETLKEPSCLKEIDASGTGVPVISRSISNFINLSKLDVSCNSINWLPDELCSLKNLTSLIAHKNQLAMLPRNIGDMGSLRELKVSHNNLNELPDSMELLGNLQYIDLYDNEFETFPGVIGKLSNLIGLDIEQNYFPTDGISLDRDVHYEGMRDVLRGHWGEDKKTVVNGVKSKPPEEADSDDERRSPTSSTSTSESSSYENYLCSYPEESVNQTSIEHWDSSDDTADEFDPHECKGPRIRPRPPITCYNPFRPIYCPADSHKERTATRVIEMLRNGTLVWPTNYEEGQFEDP